MFDERKDYFISHPLMFKSFKIGDKKETGIVDNIVYFTESIHNIVYFTESISAYLRETREYHDQTQDICEIIS